MNDDNKHTEIIELAIKQNANEATEEELKRLSELLTEDPVHQQIYDDYLRTWNLTGSAHGITLEEIQAEWQRVDEVIEGFYKPRTKVQFMRLAATFALLLLSTYFLYQFLFDNRTVEVTAEELSIQPMIDGTLITMNTGARLSYNESYNLIKREMTLEGEAFFDVADDATKPFIIRAGDTKIEVLGTSFNVSAERDKITTEIVVVDGRVSVVHENRAVVLVRGEKATINRKSGELMKIINDDPNFQSWRTMQFEFSDLPLSKVLDRLSDVFDVPLLLKNKGLAVCPVTVSFNNQSLESIVEVLTTTLDLTMEKTNKGLVFDGEGCE